MFPNYMDAAGNEGAKIVLFLSIKESELWVASLSEKLIMK